MNKDERNKLIAKDYIEGLSTIKLAQKYNLGQTTILRILDKENVQRRNHKEKGRKYNHDKDFFEVIDTEAKAYWLGFLYADGYIQSNKNVFGISISDKDIEHLEQFKKDIKSDNPINIYNSNGYGEGKCYCRLLITSDKTVSDLINKGMLEHKTNILQFPTEEQVPRHLIHHFIRGYFDGDGCITSYMCGGYIRYKTSFLGTEDFLDGINIIINELYGIKINNYYKRKNHQTVSSLEYSSNKRSKILYNFMYKDATIYLNRKHEIFSRLIK